MNLKNFFGSFTARLFHRSKAWTEMEEELRSHIQHRADDLERSGISRAEAERCARIEFGGEERFKEECREASGGILVESAWLDLRFAWRLMRKSPVFVIVAVMTLALGIGANAIVFSAIDAFFVHPLNLPQEDSLYAVWRANVTAEESYPDYLELRDRNHSFDGLAGYSVSMAALDSDGNPSRAWINEVTGNYFDVLGIQPYLGRFFHSSDEHGPNSAPFVVLSYAYWRNHFQGDRGIVGRKVLVNKHPFIIAGVAPPGFHGTLLFFNPAFFVPMVNQEQVDGSNELNTRKNRFVFMVMGHLRAGVTPAKASADLNSIGADLERNYPKEDSNMKFSLARPGLYGDYLGRPIKAFLTGLTVLAGLILLAACANLGSLFAARASDRSREIALRLALGSSRIRIARQLFTEALLISLIGGAAGLYMSMALLSALSAWQPFVRYPVYVAVTPDAGVYVASLLLAVLSGFLFATVPVRQALRTDPYQVIKAGSISSPGKRLSARELLLLTQVAICALLVTCSMVAVRGLLRSLHGNFGFEPRNAMLADTDLSMGGYTGDKIPQVQIRMIDALRTIPGVDSVGLSDWTQLGVNADSKSSRVYFDKTADRRPTNPACQADTFSISSDYFRAAGTNIVRGRTFTLHDDQNAPRVAVINQEFARRIFGQEASAIDGYFMLQDGTRVRVVGIAEDGKYDHITEDPKPAMFLPIMQSPSGEAWFIIRSKRDPQHLAPDIRSKLREVDAGLPLIIGIWNQELDLAFFGPRLATNTLGVLGAIGGLLSLTGIFGMAAYSVSKRKKELGIRMALGAQRGEVLHAALGRAFKLLAIGSAAGLLLGILASRLLALIVYSATPRDPLVLAGAVLAMFILGLLATWVPAQRALSIDPLALLREE